MIRRAKGDERGKLLADVKTNIARRGGAKTLVIARFAPDPIARRQEPRRAGAIVEETA